MYDEHGPGKKKEATGCSAPICPGVLRQILINKPAAEPTPMEGLYQMSDALYWWQPEGFLYITYYLITRTCWRVYLKYSPTRQDL